MAPTTRTSTRLAKRVAFEGAEYIEYDADQPAAVRLCGAWPSGGAYSAELECAARGLDAPAIAAAGGTPERALEARHAEEARRMLELRGFSPLGERPDELRAQLRAADLLLAWAALADAPSSASPEGADADANANADADDLKAAAPDACRLERVLPRDWRTHRAAVPSLLRRAQLARKELEGRVDDGYAFGRRFVSAEAFVDSLERAEVLEMARARGLPLPEVGEAERAAIKIPDRALVALRGPGAGKTLKQLTLRELVAEAQAHGVDVDQARDGGASKSKRAWIDVLRPLVHEDMLKIRVLMREEVLLRELVTDAVEREAAEDQRRRVRALVQALVGQAQPPQSCQPDAEPASGPATAASDGASDGDATEQPSKSHSRLDRYLEELAAAIQPPPE